MVLVVHADDYYNKLAANFGEVTNDVGFFSKNTDKFKLVMFTGGEDVCPAFYNHSSPKKYCGYNIGRDLAEKEVFITALEYNIPMTGICRGSQFLNVMSGGWLMHHITNHGFTHEMTTLLGETFQVTSTHHQMCVPSTDGFIIGFAAEKRSKIYIGDSDLPVDYTGPETEAIYYPNNQIFAVQYHPEYMNENSAAYLWYKNGVQDLLTLSEAAFKVKYGISKSLSASA